MKLYQLAFAALAPAAVVATKHLREEEDQTQRRLQGYASPGPREGDAVIGKFKACYNQCVADDCLGGDNAPDNADSGGVRGGNYPGPPPFDYGEGDWEENGLADPDCHENCAVESCGYLYEEVVELDGFTDFLVGGCLRRRRELNEAKEGVHHRRLILEHGEGMSSIVESDDYERHAWLNEHVVEMKERMESGKTARAWDPLFRAYFENAQDIKLECDTSDDSVTCTSSSATQCGLDLIKAHAEYHEEIASLIKEHGDHVILDTHMVPESCK